MSLITLTFGNKYHEQASLRFKDKTVTRPLDGLAPKGPAKFEVKKVSQFFGDRNIYLVGIIESGVLAEQMKATIGEKTGRIVELESKFGTTAKKGMTAGIVVAGLDKEDVLAGQKIDFLV